VSSRLIKRLSSNLSPWPHSLNKGRGIKRVPRKIEDFSGCLKGVRLINNLLIKGIVCVLYRVL
jgi:hypothetical protein